jgi:hypothetical protein
MPRIERTVTIYNPDGSHKGTAVYEVENVGGKDYPLDPRPIEAGDTAALAAVMSQAQVAAAATIEAHEATIAGHAAVVTERDQALARVAELEALLSTSTDQTHEAAVKAERDRRVLGGVKVGDDWFDTTLQTQIQYIGMIMMGAGLSEQTPLWTLDGRNVGATPQRVQQIFANSAQLQAQLYSIAAAAIAADTPLDQIQWPATYVPA